MSPVNLKNPQGAQSSHGEVGKKTENGKILGVSDKRKEIAMKRGHVVGTKKERQPRKNEAYEAALFRWRMFGPQGQIAPNTLAPDDESWVLFGTKEETAA